MNPLRLLLLSLSLAACSSPASSVEGYTRLKIDTDLPTPEVASRVRVDLYRADGTWFDSREFDTGRPEAFPLSFDLAAPAEGEQTIRVRVRAFPVGYMRPYRGERFADWPAVLGDAGAAPAGDAPRLMIDGVDRTPEAEPIPSVTVDRLLTLSARAGQIDEAGVVLRGACAGVMVDLGKGLTCTSRERQREPVAAPADVVTTSQTDALREPCDGASKPGRVCVPGGVFVMGDRQQPYIADSDGFLMDGRPERLVRVRRFWMDEEEVTVARFRAMDAAGLKTAHYTPKDHNGPLSDDPTSATSCVYTSEAGANERLPLNCTPWVTFREICQNDGGDLPTEAQWEYAAAMAGSPQRRKFPWGDDEPTCDRAVYARIGSKQEQYCTMSPAQVPLDDAAAQNDRTPLGLRGMAGGVAEFVLDAPAGYLDAPWTSAPFDGPQVENPIQATDKIANDDRFMVRGGSWASPSNTLRTGFRQQGPGAVPFFGARCAYPSP